MIKRNGEYRVDLRESMCGGAGNVKIVGVVLIIDSVTNSRAPIGCRELKLYNSCNTVNCRGNKLNFSF